MNTLTIAELRFLQDALRNGVFNQSNCGCKRKRTMMDEIVDALEEGDVDDMDGGIDLELLMEKIVEMDTLVHGELIEKLNKCYFAETVAFAEFGEHEL